MQIVIDIKKREWEYLNKLVENGDQLGHYERLLVNGTPLPKEHGRLIDDEAYNIDHNCVSVFTEPSCTPVKKYAAHFTLKEVI